MIKLNYMLANLSCLRKSLLNIQGWGSKIENRHPSARQFFSTSWKIKNMPFRIFSVNFVVKIFHGNYYHDTMVIIAMNIFGRQIERNYSTRHIFQFSWKWKKLPYKTETRKIFSILDPQPYTEMGTLKLHIFHTVVPLRILGTLNSS